MKRIEIKLEEADLALLDFQAKEKGVNRSDLIRHRLFADTPGRAFTPEDLSRLVSRVNRVSNLPRSEVERLVNYVFVEVMSGPREATNPVL